MPTLEDVKKENSSLNQNPENKELFVESLEDMQQRLLQEITAQNQKLRTEDKKIETANDSIGLSPEEVKEEETAMNLNSNISDINADAEKWVAESITALNLSINELPSVNTIENQKIKEVSPEDVFKKTEQSIRILSTLWDKRFDVLGQYYGQRNKKRFNPLNSEASIKAEIKDTLLKITPINDREEKVVEILERGTVSGQEILQKTLQQPENISESETEAISEFNEKVNSFSSIIQKYTELVSQHKDILELERELIDSPDEVKFELYLKRMDTFSSEFKVLEEGKIEELKKYFGDIESDLKKIDEARKKGIPLEILKQSFVSAVVRLALANIPAGLFIGNPLENPYFWQLNVVAIPIVTAINFVDYYSKVFTKITQKINNIVK